MTFRSPWSRGIALGLLAVAWAATSTASTGTSSAAPLDTSTSPGPLADIEEIIIESSRGTFEKLSSTVRYIRQGDELVADDRRVPLSLGRELARSLLASEQKQTLDVAADLGVTREAFLRHRADILAVVDRQNAAAHASTIASEELTYERVCDQACTLTGAPITYEFSGFFGWRGHGMGGDSVRVRFRGDAQDISARSRAFAPWRLPWAVTCGPRTWKTWSVDVPRAIVPLALPDPRVLSVLDGTSYWRDEFWRDGNWSSRCWASDRARHRAVAQLMSDEASSSFKLLQNITCFPVDTKPHIFLILAPRGSRASPDSWVGLPGPPVVPDPIYVDQIDWDNPLTPEGLLTFGWGSIKSSLVTCSKLLARQPWIRAWKDQAPDRIVEACALQDINTQGALNWPTVTEAWRQAGLQGQPEVFVKLMVNHGTRFRGGLWLSGADPRALVTRVFQEGGGHWFDDLDVNLAAPPHSYVVVEPDGRHDRRLSDAPSPPQR